MRAGLVGMGWLSVLGLALVVDAPAARAQGVQVKPYMMVILDSSGSMAWDSARDPSPPNSCGYPSSPMNDAKCAVTRVVDATGDALFGLMQFDQPCSTRCCSLGAADNESVWLCGPRGRCDDSYLSAVIRVPIYEENQYEILSWVDNVCGSSCRGSGVREMWARGATPLAGSLRRARWYFRGDGTGSLETPFYDDPYAECRPAFVVLLTDGQETCGGNPARRAADLRSTRITLSGGSVITKDIRTYVIGFRLSAPNRQIESIATSGGTDAPGPYRAFYANDEESLALAFSQIIGDSILVESCNGVDDDCDGLIDEGFTLYCDRPTVPSPTLCTDPGESVCDGVDDNCNGLVDEGLTNACGTCGPAPTEVCDGLDNDCDGIIDEGGVCSGCIPSSEVCDGLDNDCDGTIDEGLTRVCGTDVGLCTTGTQTCSAGSWGPCTGTGPTTETCNGEDDDCDGVIDGITRPCGSDVGACQTGTELCTGGVWGSCTGAIGPSTEICDGIDNDCDGLVDEGNPGGGGSCGSAIGECVPGTLECMGGALVCTGGVSPTPESCNGLDDDCDGATDEEIPTMGSCGSAIGECSEGVLTCVGGTFTCVGATGPTAEVCDGRDNDCDGLVDEGNPGGGVPCGTATGVCELGTSECIGGVLECTGGVGPSTEVCDGLDNDCDGLVDEGNPGGGAPCGTTDEGECEYGALACVGGSLSCVGETGPASELCDGLDNDCDGLIDEGNPEGGGPCGEDTGECEPGTWLCMGGSLVCDGAIGPTMEVCNGLDDDCDGVVDDGIPVGAPCGTDIGECTPGVNVCRGGVVVCEGATEPIPEVCDLLDNDCDGSIDEGLPAGVPCGTDEGLCRRGTLQCVSGREICVGGMGPTRESCDCEDNDCDGTVDEAPDSGSLCPEGSACVDCQCALPCAETEFGFSCPSGRTPKVDGDECHCVMPRCEAETCATETVTVAGTVRCAPDSAGLPTCVCKGNRCTFPCEGVVCEDGLVCEPRTGACEEPVCPVFECGEDEVCDLDSGECVDDPCATAGCGAGEACRGGVCEASCATVSCPDGEVCASGACVDDPCAGVSCEAGEVCDPDTGDCVEDMCEGLACPAGRLCDPVTGRCVADPCNELRCPEGEECIDGECAEHVPDVDAGVADAGGVDAGTRFDAGSKAEEDDHARVLATGGGGCICSTPGGDREAPPWLALLVAGSAVVRRIRRSRR